MTHEPLEAALASVSADLIEEWLSVLPASGEDAPLSPADLEALTRAPEVLQFGATVALRYGLDTLGLPRTGLLVRHADPGAVARTRDALLLQGRRLGLRVFLV